MCFKEQGARSKEYNKLNYKANQLMHQAEIQDGVQDVIQDDR